MSSTGSIRNWFRRRQASAVFGGRPNAGMGTPLIPYGPSLARDRRRMFRSVQLKRRKFWQQPLAVTGMILLGGWIIVAVFAPLIAPYDPLEQMHDRYMEPGPEAVFGSDHLGRDVLSRIIWGSRLTIPYSALLIAISLTIGFIVGGIAGYRGGKVDEVLMRFTDMVMSFPTIILAMAVAAVIGPGLFNAVVAAASVHWPVFARVIRSYILSLRKRDFVVAARLLGASPRRTMFRDIIPNMAGPVMVLAMVEMANAILLLSGLSFLGLGAQPPEAEWGKMVAEGAQVLNRWWVGTFSGLAILTVVLAFNLIGDTLRDWVDPRIS